LRRFEQEARALGALNHPNIIVVHDVAVIDGEPCIVTELLEGKTLRQLLKEGPVAPEMALDLAKQLADGLAAAHAKGVVRRGLEKDPARRFESAADLVAALGGTPPISRRTRARRSLIAAAALVAAAATFFAIRRPSRPLDRSAIAVLPFVNLSADKDYDYFSDGFSE